MFDVNKTQPTVDDLQKAVEGKPLHEQVAILERELSIPASPAPEKAPETPSPAPVADADKGKKPEEAPTPEDKTGEAKKEPENPPAPTAQAAPGGERDAKLDKRIADNAAAAEKAKSENEVLRKQLEELRERQREFQMTAQDNARMRKEMAKMREAELANVPERLTEDPDLDKAIEYKLKKHAFDNGNGKNDEGIIGDTPTQAEIDEGILGFQSVVHSIVPNAADLMNDPAVKKDLEPMFEDWQKSGEPWYRHPIEVARALTVHMVNKAKEEASIQERENLAKGERERKLAAMNAPTGGTGSSPTPAADDDAARMEKLKKMSLAEMAEYANQVAAGRG